MPLVRRIVCRNGSRGASSIEAFNVGGAYDICAKYTTEYRDSSKVFGSNRKCYNAMLELWKEVIKLPGYNLQEDGEMLSRNCMLFMFCDQNGYVVDEVGEQLIRSIKEILNTVLGLQYGRNSITSDNKGSNTMRPGAVWLSIMKTFAAAETSYQLLRCAPKYVACLLTLPDGVKLEFNNEELTTSKISATLADKNLSNAVCVKDFLHMLRSVIEAIDEKKLSSDYHPSSTTHTGGAAPLYLNRCLQQQNATQAYELKCKAVDNNDAPAAKRVLTDKNGQCANGQQSTTDINNSVHSSEEDPFTQSLRWIDVHSSNEEDSFTQSLRWIREEILEEAQSKKNPNQRLQDSITDTTAEMSVTQALVPRTLSTSTFSHVHDTNGYNGSCLTCAKQNPHYALTCARQNLHHTYSDKLTHLPSPSTSSHVHDTNGYNGSCLTCAKQNPHYAHRFQFNK